MHWFTPEYKLQVVIKCSRIVEVNTYVYKSQGVDFVEAWIIIIKFCGLFIGCYVTGTTFCHEDTQTHKV